MHTLAKIRNCVLLMVNAITPKRFARVFFNDSFFFNQLSSEDQPVILVGGGSILIDVRAGGSKCLKGASDILCPNYYQVVSYHISYHIISYIFIYPRIFRVAWCS